MTRTLIVSSVLLWIVVLCNVLISLALVRQLNSKVGKRSASLALGGLDVGREAPAFTAETLHGETVSSTFYVGRTVAFLIVSPSCGPCREVVPSYEALRDGAEEADIELIVVSTGDADKTREFARELQIRLPILIAPQGVNPFMEDYKVTATPFYYLVDNQGKITARDVPRGGRKGSEWNALVEMWAHIPVTVTSG